MGLNNALPILAVQQEDYVENSIRKDEFIYIRIVKGNKQYCFRKKLEETTLNEET